MGTWGLEIREGEGELPTARGWGPASAPPGIRLPAAAAEGSRVKQTRGRRASLGCSGAAALAQQTSGRRRRWGRSLRSLPEGRRPLLVPEPGVRPLGWPPLFLRSLPSLGGNERSRRRGHLTPSAVPIGPYAYTSRPTHVCWALKEARLAVRAKAKRNCVPLREGRSGTRGGLRALSSVLRASARSCALPPTPEGFRLGRWPLLRRGPVVSPGPVTLRVSDPPRRPAVSGVARPALPPSLSGQGRSA